VTHLYPAELQKLIDPTIVPQNLRNEKQKKKSTIDKIDEALDATLEEDEDIGEIEQDNDYEQDELDDEDGPDDYNAEQYFDNGEDDALEDDGGGDYD
jgi:DNA-directed RNA polymerase III subunit RPC7